MGAGGSMAYWLLKTEPDVFSWSDLQRNGVACWDGVRNYAARNHLRAMQVQDLLLIYHSNADKAAVAIARVVRTHYPDPTTVDERWSAVDVAPVCALHMPVPLALIRAEGQPGRPLADMRMLRENRLSVSPVSPAEWLHILHLAQTVEPIGL